MLEKPQDFFRLFDFQNILNSRDLKTSLVEINEIEYMLNKTYPPTTTDEIDSFMAEQLGMSEYKGDELYEQLFIKFKQEKLE